MNRSTLAIAGLCTAGVLGFGGKAWTDSKPARAPGRVTAAAPAPPTMLAGVAWEPSLAQAREKAQRAGKPILMLHLFGKLNEEFC